MANDRIFARKNAIEVMSKAELEAVSGGWDEWDGGFSLNTYGGYNTNPTQCAGPQGNPGDWQNGIVYYIEDDCGRDM